MSSLVAATTAYADDTDPTPTTPATALQQAEQQASEQARSTGETVPVDAATDAFTTLNAQPDGSFTATVSNVPERVQRDDTWVPVDATLQHNPDGTYSPAASSNPLVLSGGGTGPLATLDNGGKQLAISWPTALPAPQVAGDIALYPGVLPDVDLKVTAGTDGAVSELLVVHTAEAAANPALHQLTFGTDTSDGVTITADAGGNLTATDASGAAVFHSAAPMMWDSTTTAQTQTTASASPAAYVAALSAETSTGTTTEPTAGDTPGPGAQTAPVATSITDNGDIQLTPDTDLLTGDKTQYPVYIDPGWVSTTLDQTGWTFVQEGYPSVNHYDDSDSANPGVGYQHYSSPYGRERTWYQFNFGNLGSRNIQSATLNTTQTYSADWSCTTYDVRVDNTDYIDLSTTWINQPKVWGYESTQPVTGAGNTGCAGGTNIGFGVTEAVSGDGDGIAAFRLMGTESSSTDNYKRFAKKATLTIVYNTVPNVPSSTVATPAPVNRTGTSADKPQGCDSDGGYGWIGKLSTNLTLSAHVSDPDGSNQNVAGQFSLWDDGPQGTDNPATSVIALGGTGSTGNSVPGTGGTSSIQVAASKLANGHMYGWRARAYDSIDVSDTAPNCHFWVDTTAPSVKAIATFDGVAGGTGTLTISGSDPKASDGGRASGIDHFAYTLSGDVHDLDGNGGSVAPADGKITYSATAWGTQVIWVKAVDNAGNQSQPLQVTFYVKDDVNASVSPGDIDGLKGSDGLTHPDMLAIDSTGKLRLYPITEQAAASATAADSADAPDGTSWTGTLIAHRLSTTGALIDDLWAHKPGSPSLYIYINNATLHAIDPTTGRYFTSDNRHPITRPECKPEIADCSDYATDWSQVTRMTAPGDVNGDGNPDLFTVENDHLWFFPGTFLGGYSFGAPQRVGATGWGVGDLLAPGDDTNDGTPDLWLRVTSTGALLRYTLNYDASTGTVTWSTKTQIGTLGLSTYPLVTTLGDINGDAGTAADPAYADVWATNADTNLYYWNGNGATTGTAFGTRILKGTGGWNTITTIS